MISSSLRGSSARTKLYSSESKMFRLPIVLLVAGASAFVPSLPSSTPWTCQTSTRATKSSRQRRTSSQTIRFGIFDEMKTAFTADDAQAIDIDREVMERESLCFLWKNDGKTLTFVPSLVVLCCNDDYSAARPHLIGGWASRQHQMSSSSRRFQRLWTP